MTPARPNAPPRASRMTLANVTRGVQVQPLRVVVFGPGGIGKSTFAAQAPSPIFLGPEDGSGLLDVTRFPQPETWTDVFDAMTTLRTDSHDFSTLAIDSADWLEPLCWEHVCRAMSRKSIEDFGYGKGYIAALEEWRKLVAALDGLRRTKRMHVIVIAHAVVAPYRNPEGDDYDRFTLKLHKGAAGLLSEWCDELAFASFRTHASKVDQKGSRGRGYGSERVLYTERRAAFDAKSRHGLPPEMPLSWEEFYRGTQRGSAELVKNIRVEIETALLSLTALDTATGEKARAAYDGTPMDASALSVLLNRINAGIAQRESARQGAADTTNNG